jgi:GH3 auxin-responsive promoter
VLDFTPPIRVLAARRRREIAHLDPIATQERVLLSLLKRAEGTRFGRDHGFSSIGSVAEFQARVPLRPYDAMWNEYWKDTFPRLAGVSWPGPAPYLALSSGTTSGKTKYLPVTPAMRKSNARAAFDVLVHHFAAQPRSHLYGGKSFLLGGSTALTQEAPGIYSGDLSGIVMKHLPIWAKPFVFPDPKLALMSDWQEKVETLAIASLDVDVRALTGTPSWVLVLLDRVRELRDARGETNKPLYPNLEMFVHGGVNFSPYRGRFLKLFEGRNVDMREVYAASEGFVASADRGFGEGMRLNVDNGLFYEFVPVEELGSPNPTRHWLADAQTGINYALVLANCAGVFGYLIGDTVRFVEKLPPRILVTGRTSYGLSAFGEHLIAEEIETGIADAAAAIGADVTDYSVGAIFKGHGSERDGHLWVVEFKKPPDEEKVERFAGVLDETLLRLNDDYRIHRSVEFGIAPPTIRAVAPGTFAAWMKSRGKLGGQNKVPRVINDRELWENLQSFAAAR